MKISKKRSGFGLEIKTIRGSKGMYVFFKTKSGSYHTLIEVAAKDAARDCGAGVEGTTRQMCKRGVLIGSRNGEKLVNGTQGQS